MEPEEILESPGVSGLWPCAWTHLKKAWCHTRPVGRMYDEYQYTDQVVTTSSGLSSPHRWQVLYFVNVIKISIPFPTSILVISHSVIFVMLQHWQCGFQQNRTHINIHEYDILGMKISAKLT